MANLNSSSTAEAFHGEERNGDAVQRRRDSLWRPLPLADGRRGALAAGVAVHLADLAQVLPHLLRLAGHRRGE